MDIEYCLVASGSEGKRERVRQGERKRGRERKKERKKERKREHATHGFNALL